MSASYRRPVKSTTDSHAICGVWEIVVDNAPFSVQLMTFHPDGTLIQSNPDRGDVMTSGTTGMGVWHADGPVVTGTFVEIVVERSDRKVVRRGLVRFTITVSDDGFTGSSTRPFYERSGKAEQATASLSGRRFMDM